MFLYNTLTRKKELFQAESPVGVYVCGVTPYDTTHLGHAFTYTAVDVLVRYLRFKGYDVLYVQNITDVDDDILLRAASTGVDWRELGDRETRKYLDDMTALNNLPPHVMPRAAEHIPDMIGIIERLLEKGLAYRRDGNVYFEVRRQESFGKLCRLAYRAQLELANERGNFPDDPLKKDPLDFVLWQAKKEGEPSWPSPWGEGRPGWHIECSAMSMKYLGESFALHGGGQDLVFPHHECEIAQSETCTGKPFARYWFHTGMVYSGSKKMSKSLGNMVFVSDLLREYSSDTIRLYLLGHQYRRNWNFEAEDLAAHVELAAELADATTDPRQASGEDLEHWARPFFAAMDDDLDTPRSLDELRALASEADAAARRTLRTLGERMLGLTFER
ncbi:MAG: cysteine--tRNA ligase [Chloroflexi bacterium]|nr:cysteine--tRNA ligase [Chloroflexota bacterium]